MTRRESRSLTEDILLVCLLFFAPMALGSVHAWAYSIIAIASLILFNLRFFNNTDSLIEVLQKPASIAFILFVGAVFLYLVPLPAFIVKIFSPSTFNLREKYAIEATNWQTLSLYPHATIVYLVKCISYLMIFFIVASKIIRGVPIKASPAYHAAEARSNFLFFGALTAVFAILLHSLSDFNLHIPANALYFSVCLAVIAGLSSKKNRNSLDYFFFERLVNAVIVIGFIVAVFGIAQKLGANGKIYWFFEMDGAHFGPYINYDHSAGFMEMCTSLSVAFFVAHIMMSSFAGHKKIKDKIIWFSSSEANKTLIYLFFSIVMASALFLTTSRGGILSFIAAMSVFFFLYAISVRRKKRNRIFLSIILIIVLISIMVIWIGPEETVNRFKALNGIIRFFIKEKAILSEIRPFMWKDTVSLIKDFPVTGVGLGAFAYVFPAYRTFSIDYGFLRYAHNDYLQFIAEMGLFGVTFIVGFFVWYVRRMRECLKRLGKY